MNGRKARLLRQIAGGNKADYIEGTPPVYFDISKLPEAPEGMLPTYQKVGLGVPTKLRGISSRGIYQRLKKISSQTLIL